MSLLLARFDRYILDIAYRYRETYTYLHDESLEDLYQAGVVGFYRAVDRFKPNLHPGMIFLTIKAYVRKQIEKEFAYKAKMHFQPYFTDADDLFFTKSPNDVFQDQQELLSNRMLIERIMNSECLSDKEKELIQFRFYDGWSGKQLCAKYGVSFPAITCRVKRVLAKMREYLSHES
jgi:RNA polymerase sigma factor (sigma-70 family)